MRKIKLLLSFSIFTFCFSICEGQSWLWAKAGLNNTNNTLCDPYSIATDNKGNIYETGEFLGSITFGSNTMTYSGIAADAFLVKYDSNGNVLWSDDARAANSNCFSNSTSVTTDDRGNSYITGSFIDTITYGTYKLSSKNGDVFVVKYAPNGNVLWAKNSIELNRGGAQGLSVTTDNTCNVYVSGGFSDSINFGAYQATTKSNPSDVFLVKFDSNGNVLWLKSGNTPSSKSNGTANSVTTDINNNVYITGAFADTISFGSTMLVTYISPGSVFLVKFDSNGNLKWARNSIVSNIRSFFNTEASFSAITDRANNIYITGEFIDTITFGSFKLNAYGRPNNVFLAKYDTMGNAIWAQSGILSGSNASAIGYSLSIDKWNHLFLGGSFEDTISFGSVKFYSTSPLPSFIVMFDTAGKSLCGTFVINEDDDADAIAANPFSSSVYLGGDIAGSTACFFGNDTLEESTHEFSFLAKWQPCPTIITGTNDLKIKNEALSVFPNPFIGTTTISIYNSPSTIHNLELYDLNGRKLKQTEFTGNEYTLSAEGMTKGMYFVRIFDKDKNLVGTSKMVVQ